MTASEYFKFESSAEKNRWLQELPEEKQLKIKQMLAEFAAIRLALVSVKLDEPNNFTDGLG